MASLNTIDGRIDALDDERATLVLRIVVGYIRLSVPTEDWTSAKDHLIEAVVSSGLDAYRPTAGASCSDGDLARAALHYLAESGEDNVDVIDRSITYASRPGERFGLETLALGALVLAVLQTDLKLKRDTRGRWTFELHKKAMSDSALARVITTFIGRFTNLGD